MPPSRGPLPPSFEVFLNSFHSFLGLREDEEEEMGEDSDHPTDSTQYHFTDHPYFIFPTQEGLNHPKTAQDARKAAVSIVRHSIEESVLHHLGHKLTT
ncbi:hypothetical protein Tco_1303669 [Tanacetum coccineum]